MAEIIRVVIVDDHSIFRSGLRADLDASVDVVGEAADVPSAISVIGETRPDVVLLDVHLPGGDGEDAAGGEAVIRGSSPTDARFLALSVSDAAADVVRVIRAGARGYITKGSSGVEVSSAVRAVAEGDAVFSPSLPASCSTPSGRSPVRPRQRPTNSTGFRHASRRSCA